MSTSKSTRRAKRAIHDREKAKQKQKDEDTEMTAVFDNRTLDKRRLEIEKTRRINMCCAIVATVGFCSTVSSVESRHGNDLKNTEFSKAMDIFTTFTTVIALTLLVMFYRMQRRILARKGLRPSKWIMMLEFFIIAAQPIPYMEKSFILRAMGDQHGPYDYHAVASVFMLSKFYLWVRVFVDVSEFNNECYQVVRGLNKNDSSVGTIFALRAYMSTHPFLTIVMTLSFNVFGLSYALRVAEWPQDEEAYRYYWNAVWVIVVTMTTVGYGDYYPQTHAGRFVAMTACFLNLFLAAMVVVAVGDAATFSAKERSLFELGTKKNLRKQSRVLACKLIQYGWRRSRAIRRTRARAGLPDDSYIPTPFNLTVWWLNVRFRYTRYHFVKVMRDLNSLEASQDPKVQPDTLFLLRNITLAKSEASTLEVEIQRLAALLGFGIRDDGSKDGGGGSRPNSRPGTAKRLSPIPTETIRSRTNSPLPDTAFPPLSGRTATPTQLTSHAHAPPSEDPPTPSGHRMQNFLPPPSPPPMREPTHFKAHEHEGFEDIVANVAARLAEDLLSDMAAPAVEEAVRPVLRRLTRVEKLITTFVQRTANSQSSLLAQLAASSAQSTLPPGVAGIPPEQLIASGLVQPQPIRVFAQQQPVGNAFAPVGQQQQPVILADALGVVAGGSPTATAAGPATGAYGTVAGAVSGAGGASPQNTSYAAAPAVGSNVSVVDANGNVVSGTLVGGSATSAWQRPSSHVPKEPNGGLDDNARAQQGQAPDVGQLPIQHTPVEHVVVAPTIASPVLAFGVHNPASYIHQSRLSPHKPARPSEISVSSPTTPVRAANVMPHHQAFSPGPHPDHSQMQISSPALSHAENPHVPYARSPSPQHQTLAAELLQKLPSPIRMDGRDSSPIRQMAFARVQSSNPYATSAALSGEHRQSPSFRKYRVAPNLPSR